MVPNLPDAWKAYVAAEVRGIRREYLAALDAFLSSFSACPPDVRASWVSDFVERWMASPQNAPLRGALLDQAVLPHLAAQFRSGSAAAALQLAELRMSPLGSHRGWDRLDLPTSVELLREALRRDPSSESARRKLVEAHLGYIRYTLHELPAGVLIGIDGASAAECADLETFLDAVRRLMNESEAAEHGALLSEACFHYRTYRDYLQQPDKCGYASFLARLQRT